MAVWNGDAPEIVQLLIDGGAQLDAQNRDGKTALDLALVPQPERQSRAEEVYRLREWRSATPSRAPAAPPRSPPSPPPPASTPPTTTPLPDVLETLCRWCPTSRRQGRGGARRRGGGVPAAAKEEEAPAMEDEAAPAAGYRSMAAEASPEAAPSEAADEMDPLEAMVGANM